MTNRIAYLLLSTFLIACSDTQVQSSNATLEQHYSQVSLKAADISDNGRFTLLSDNAQVCLWNNNKNKLQYPCLNSLDAQMIELLGISSSNKYFYTSNRVNVHLYDLHSGRLVTVWSAGDNIINDIAMSANESKLIFGFRSGQASIVSVLDNQIATFKPHRLDINSVAISDEGDKAFTGSSDKTAVLWQTNTGKAIHRFEHQTRVNHVTMSDDASLGFTLDAIRDRSFWLLKIGAPFAELKNNIKFIEFNDAQFSDSKKWLASASPKQKIQLWQTKTGELLGQWQAFKPADSIRASVIAIEFINHNTLATVTSDGVYQTWPIQAIYP
ncbi:hypothetical protein [Thalassotalea sp. G2M2-11]|uniref:WD40 repeat domain-containing protein n=1 Tax=Thalassotalea sp. G2M2-11 TaxID=2787627 RepID=UPI0019D27F21|nr:hypothetical protein [Thalassotalea sp. G2M2-11]